MKILVLHVHGTYNHGSFMMGINFIYYFSKIYPNSIFEVELDSREDYLRLKKEVGGNIKIVRKERIQYKKDNIIENILSKKKFLFDRPKQIIEENYDAVVILGGDNISEYYSGWKVVIRLRELSILSRKIKVFLVGQTIGPFYSWRKIFARHCLKNIYIYLRDPLCAEYITKELKMNNFNVCADLAFLDLPFMREEVLSKYKLEKEKYITIIPSGSINQYTSSRKKYVSRWIEIIKDLIKKNQFAHYKIALLAHVLKEKEGDENVINEVFNTLSPKEKERVCKITEALLPSETRAILGGGLFSISGRMHGAISTFQKGKPSISLSYSVKYKGVIGMSLKRQDLIIEAKGNDLWETGKIKQMIDEKIDYLLSNYEKIKKEIKEQVSILKDKVIWQIKDIANKIENS